MSAPVRATLRARLTHASFLLLICATIAGLQFPAGAQRFSLGSAQPFGVLGGSTVTNTGPSVINGNLGVSPGSAITGFPPGIVLGSTHSADAVAAQAQIDATIAYNALAAMAVTADLTGQNLGGLILTPGVYFFASSAQLTGALTLNALGDPNALFVFQIGSALTTASGSIVNVINGGDACNVFWQVGSSATLGTTTAFEGNILANASITLNTGATIIDGRALAQTGAVTLDTNNISIAGCPVISGPPGTIGDVVPEGQSLLMLLCGGLPIVGIVLRRRSRRWLLSDRSPD